MDKSRRLQEEIYRHLPGVIAVLFAIWLLFPFIKIDRSDYTQGKILVYRLAFGLMIMIIMLGKMGFDVFFPQGIARPVSNTKSVLFLILGILLLAFVVYIIIQAGALFMSSYPDTSEFNQ
ncbi:MAG: hypothetical protein ACUVRL_09895 [Candidatus Saccharicenans sp.]|uniref:hypothetical protein n=1 Tax=Candidatus Saccharicenans sp. TaxID=2819258 RepID=UPI00404B7EF6